MLLGAVERIFVGLHLILEAGQDLQIARRLGGQFAQMLIFEHTQFRFLRRQFGACLIELIFQELGRVLGTLLPLLQVFRDEQVRQLGRRPLRHLRIAIRVIDIEGRKLPIIAVRKFDVDVLGHLRHQIVGALMMLPLFCVKTNRVDDLEQPGAAQDLLRDAV